MGRTSAFSVNLFRQLEQSDCLLNFLASASSKDQVLWDTPHRYLPSVFLITNTCTGFRKGSCFTSVVICYLFSASYRTRTYGCWYVTPVQLPLCERSKIRAIKVRPRPESRTCGQQVLTRLFTNRQTQLPFWRRYSQLRPLPPRFVPSVGFTPIAPSDYGWIFRGEYGHRTHL